MVYRVKGQTVVYACAELARSILCRWYHKIACTVFRLKCTESSSNTGKVRFDWTFGPRESARCILAEASLCGRIYWRCALFGK